MKTAGLALLSVALASCASPDVRVTHTDRAMIDAPPPKAIYIRPFRIACASFDPCVNDGAKPIRQALAPVEFANDLQEELAKIAPSRVLEPDEYAPLGWLVDGEFQQVQSGYSPGWWNPCVTGPRDSCINLHIRIRDLCQRGAVVYEFDVAAGTQKSPYGSIYKPGLGYPLPFDFRNTAELIALTITPDPFRYGYRNSPVLRY
ncbi:MAG: hypothetical protein NTZ46_03735 [Verrucomicrobia bacterium]|nr:hypothetical protein [Verrucomicrobiota bacterium]